MPQLGFIIDKQAYSFDEALAYAATGTAPVPVEFLKALIGDQRDSDMPSPSVLGGCLRKFILERRTDYHAALSSGLPAFFGTAMHAYLERFAAPGALTEQHLSATVPLGLPEPYAEVTLGGTADYIDPEYDGGAGVLRDWKTKVYLPQKDFYASGQHLRQLNTYHWLWVQNGHRPLKYWELLYFSQTAEPRFFRGELSDPEKVGRWVAKKLREWAQHHRDGTLPPVVPEFDQRGARGALVAPCSYCPVRDACVLAYEVEAKSGNPAAAAPDEGPAAPVED